MKIIAEGIYEIDAFYLNQNEITSCYLLEDQGQLAFVETSTNLAVPRLLDALKALDFKPEQVKYVIVTHIHLDHAGGAGQLMNALPQAKLVVHPRGRRHLVNPEKLVAGVKQVYGEKKYQELYGDIVPVNQDRVEEVKENDKLMLGKRVLELIDSPGHAKHHFFLWDHKSRSVFSGDSFGLSYPKFSFNNFRLVFPSTSPVQFEPEEALATYNNIVDLDPSRICFTHFGALENVEDAHNQLTAWIDFSVEIAERRFREGYRGNELDKVLQRDVEERFEEVIFAARKSHLSQQEKAFLALDCELNAQGLAFYIQKKHLKVKK